MGRLPLPHPYLPTDQRPDSFEDRVQQNFDALARAAGRASTAASLILTGTGTPEGAVTANVGTLYTDQAGGAGTTLYVKESGTGNTGWVAK